METAKAFVIAIDGPVASGKGTIAPLLAKELSGVHIDTGVFYRCMALYCIQNNINFSDIERINQVLPEIEINIENNHVFLNGNDVTIEIRNREVSNGASQVGAIDEVQKAIVEKERKLVRQKLSENMIVVIEGRNAGTAVVPEAEFKIYLTARLDVRAQRRLKQFEDKGYPSSIDEVEKDIQERDKRDSERKTYPLVSEPGQYGYFLLDNSEMTEKETLETIINNVKEGL